MPRSCLFHRYVRNVSSGSSPSTVPVSWFVVVIVQRVQALTSCRRTASVASSRHLVLAVGRQAFDDDVGPKAVHRQRLRQTRVQVGERRGRDHEDRVAIRELRVARCLAGADPLGRTPRGSKRTSRSGLPSRRVSQSAAASPWSYAAQRSFQTTTSVGVAVVRVRHRQRARAPVRSAPARRLSAASRSTRASAPHAASESAPPAT